MMRPGKIILGYVWRQMGELFSFERFFPGKRILGMETPSTRVAPRRLLSLDALRGLDMFIIIGLDSLLRALAQYMPEGVRNEIWRQLGHCSWEGLTVYDLVFPLFVFISGASMYFSLSRAGEQGKSRWTLTGKLWKRAIILSFLGILVSTWDMYTYFVFTPSLNGFRYASVLALIGISCALAGTAAIWLRRTWVMIVLSLTILVGVWSLQHFGGDMTPSGCINAKVDQWLCPGVLHNGTYDPEGPLCIVSAAALALLGYGAGHVCRSALGMGKQAGLLTLMGCVCLILGSNCGAVIKGIWTPAFVLMAGGFSFLLLAAFRVLCDRGRVGERLSLPLRVVGMNALLIYLITHLPGFGMLCEEGCDLLMGALTIDPSLRSVVFAAFYLVAAWFVCFLLWSKRIFIKI